MIFLPIRVLFNPYLLPIVIFVGGFVAFKMSVPECPAIPENAHIFVLTGDPRRIPFALEKLEKYPRRRLYIIGAGTPTFETEYQSQIEIESDSKTTHENATAIRRISQKRLLTEIVLITTEDHVNRSRFLIKKEVPYIKVKVCPVPLTKMQASKRLERWVEEYVKFLGSVVGLTSRKG